jgi:hypothetical protein
MKTVNLNDIRIDGGTQSRSVIDQALVYQYIECMKEGDEFPPIETMFDGVVHWLVDGFHRYHAYKLMGIKQTTVTYKPGTQQEAQVRSFGVNGTHGKQRTIEDKRNAVLAAFEHPLTKDKSDREIARICSVSHPFVAGVRNPEKKEKRAKEKKAAEPSGNVTTEPTGNVTTDEAPKAPPAPVDLNAGAAPDEDELRANELAMQADMDIMYKMLESDEPLKVANEEIKRLNHQNAQLEIRLHGLMNERNQAIKMVKDLQKQLDKAKAKK